MIDETKAVVVGEMDSDYEQPIPAKPDREIVMASLDELHPFPGHPFRVMMDADMERLVTSIRNNGVLVPAIVRPMRSSLDTGGRKRPGLPADPQCPWRFAGIWIIVPLPSP